MCETCLCKNENTVVYGIYIQKRKTDIEEKKKKNQPHTLQRMKLVEAASTVKVLKASPP